MNALRLVSVLVLSVVIVGCASVNQYPKYANNNASVDSSWIAAHEVLPIWVDKKFTHDQQEVIYKVINEWNYVLNGYMTIEVKDWKLDPDSDKGQAVIEGIAKSEGIAILAMTDDDPRLMGQETEGTLAFVNGIGHRANTMVVLTDHMGSISWHQILLHEFGHALGALHVDAPSLMHPYALSGYQADCIDRITAEQVATYHHFKLAHMNYCVLPDP